MTSSFFFNDTATTEIYTLSLHDALPISHSRGRQDQGAGALVQQPHADPSRHHGPRRRLRDRKSTRLNSSHANISYAVFCLKKKPMARRLPPSQTHAYWRSITTHSPPAPL